MPSAVLTPKGRMLADLRVFPEEASEEERVFLDVAAAGRAALVDWFRNDAEIPEDASIYILDESGADILGRQFPDQYADFVNEFVIGDPITNDSNFRPVQLAPKLIDADGRIYAFLVLPKGFSLWGSWATALSLITVAVLVAGSDSRSRSAFPAAPLESPVFFDALSYVFGPSLFN